MALCDDFARRTPRLAPGAPLDIFFTEGRGQATEQLPDVHRGREPAVEPQAHEKVVDDRAAQHAPVVKSLLVRFAAEGAGALVSAEQLAAFRAGSPEARQRRRRGRNGECGLEAHWAR